MIDTLAELSSRASPTYRRLDFALPFCIPLVIAAALFSLSIKFPLAQRTTTSERIMDPLTPSQILSSMLEPITPLIVDDEETQDDGECPICLETFADAVQTPCGHIFCDRCIRKALSLSDQCPLCKHRLLDSLTQRLQNREAREYEKSIFSLLASAIGMFPLLGLFFSMRWMLAANPGQGFGIITDHIDFTVFKGTIAVVAVFYIMTLAKWIERRGITKEADSTRICTTLGVITGIVVKDAGERGTMRLAEMEMAGLMLIMIIWLWRQGSSSDDSETGPLKPSSHTLSARSRLVRN
ncbi:hypothetical protein K431DRAFT_5937 [Polychaeton citri CBS 116435]|uniref:RING-type domain-containing protein n=1 Tax=Polychaeton citri CBS 116435 TaxID=1314669 RepID=A0A9P4QJZ5_9PEZI|nr:hypothetical protein K431DRAFT_5937 [Polychaeton citri CBS 116435]